MAIAKIFLLFISVLLSRAILCNHLSISTPDPAIRFDNGVDEITCAAANLNAIRCQERSKKFISGGEAIN